MSQESRTPAGRPPHAGAPAPGLEVIFLGTGARWPTPERGVAAALVARGGEHLFVDCGEGTQVQMMRSTAGLGRLGAVVLTHLHADHVLGLPGLLATLADGRRTPLPILAPRVALLEGRDRGSRGSRSHRGPVPQRGPPRLRPRRGAARRGSPRAEPPQPETGPARLLGAGPS